MNESIDIATHSGHGQTESLASSAAPVSAKPASDTECKRKPNVRNVGPGIAVSLLRALAAWPT